MANLLNRISELAEKVGSNKSYISKVERGKTEPKVSTFSPNCRCFGTFSRIGSNNINF